MKFTLAIIIGKVLRFAGKFVKRSTNLPGHIALKIYPDILKNLKISGKVIAITGSNGKTTTSNLVAHILRDNGYKVIINKEGSNMVSGCVTTLIANCDLRGHINADFIVLETDERHARFIYKDLKLDYMLITNLLRDQVVRNGHPDIIKYRILQAISEDTTLILNANDPITEHISPSNPRIYFGMSKTSRSTSECENITHDCKVCPLCFSELTYEYFHYNHIGQFRCKGCGNHTPPADFICDNIDFNDGSFTINKFPAKVSYNTIFHFSNATAAVALTTTCGVLFEDAALSLSTFKVSKERYNEFTVDGRKTVLMLTKQNPVSLDQSISFVINRESEKTVVLYVNNVIYLENKDISWLYDVSFERLLGKSKYIVCAGSRAYDIAVRLKLAGFRDEEIFICDQLSDFKQTIKTTHGPIYVLAASAFGGEDGVLEVLKKS